MIQTVSGKIVLTDQTCRFLFTIITSDQMSIVLTESEIEILESI